MPPRFTADSLPQDQTLFLLGLICDHKTNRFIEAEFKEKFEVKLSKSALARWRKVAGDELADRAMLVKLQAAQMAEDLGVRPDADKYQIVMKSMQDHLLTAMSEVNKQSPAQLIIIHQEELRRKLRERELGLKERAQAFAEEQARKSEQLEKDRFAIGADTWRFILAFIKEKDPTAVDALLKHNAELLEGLETYLENAA